MESSVFARSWRKPCSLCRSGPHAQNIYIDSLGAKTPGITAQRSSKSTRFMMAAQIARQVLNTFDDDEDTFDYVLALALDGEDVTPF